MNAMTATGTRERIHGMPDCCVVAGMGVTGCSDPGRDVATTVGAVTGGRVLFVVTADRLPVTPDVCDGVGRPN